MSSKIRWSLPDGVDELLPPKAIEVEMLRRKLIDEYISSGFEFITPPLLESVSYTHLTLPTNREV